MAASLRPHFDKYAFGIDVDVCNVLYCWRDKTIQEFLQDSYRIVQFARPEPGFDVSNAGTLNTPDGQEMPYDECLRLHFHFCLRMYVAYPPPGVQTYTLREIENLQDDAGMYEVDESLPELHNPIWNSPLGREVLRAAMTRGCTYLFKWSICSSLLMVFKYPICASNDGRCQARKPGFHHEVVWRTTPGLLRTYGAT